MPRLFVVSFLFIFSLGILIISIFRVASIRYDFKLAPSPSPGTICDFIEVDYALPYPEGVGPDNPLWSLRVLRDKLWLAVTANPLKKSNISLFLADQRLAFGKKLIDQGKVELGVSVLAKAERYLQNSYDLMALSRQKGEDVALLAEKMSLASLKHRQVLETISLQVPEDAKPIVVRITDTPKIVFEKSTQTLNDLGKTSPKNPFE